MLFWWKNQAQSVVRWQMNRFQKRNFKFQANIYYDDISSPFSGLRVPTKSLVKRWLYEMLTRLRLCLTRYCANTEKGLPFLQNVNEGFPEVVERHGATAEPGLLCRSCLPWAVLLVGHQAPCPMPNHFPSPACLSCSAQGHHTETIQTIPIACQVSFTVIFYVSQILYIVFYSVGRKGYTLACMRHLGLKQILA